MISIYLLLDSLRIPLKKRLEHQNGGKLIKTVMAKIQKICAIQPTLGFTEFDILEKYRKSFECSEPGQLHSVFPFKELARAMGLKERSLGRKSYFSAEGKIP